MGIYIKGMEMPDYGYVCIKVFTNGDVVMTKEKRGGLVVTGINEHIGMAIPVPPHGRLIDADELSEHAWRDKLDSRELIARMIDNAPTIIPAEEG